MPKSPAILLARQATVPAIHHTRLFSERFDQPRLRRREHPAAEISLRHHTPDANAVEFVQSSRPRQREGQRLVGMCHAVQVVANGKTADIIAVQAGVCPDVGETFAVVVEIVDADRAVVGDRPA